MTRFSRWAAVLAGYGLLAAGGAGCGTSEGPPGTRRVADLADIVGTYELSHATSPQKPVVPGTTLRLEVLHDRIGFDAGCNYMSASARLDDSRLILDDMMSEAMACSPEEVMTQEDWMTDFFRSRPVVEYADNVLTITASNDNREIADTEPTSLRLTLVTTSSP